MRRLYGLPGRYISSLWNGLSWMRSGWRKWAAEVCLILVPSSPLRQATLPGLRQRETTRPKQEAGGVFKYVES